MKSGIWSKLWLFTAAYFILIFVNIHLALLALICFSLPVYFLLRDQKKSWCQLYCPRASLLMKIPRSKNQPLRPIPAWLIGKKARQWVVRYFILNLLFYHDVNDHGRIGPDGTDVDPAFSDPLPLQCHLASAGQPRSASLVNPPLLPFSVDDDDLNHCRDYPGHPVSQSHLVRHLPRRDTVRPVLGEIRRVR